MASTPFNYARFLMLKKIFDFANDAFKIILMNSSYVLDVVNHTCLADISPTYELLGVNGYTVGGATLGGISITQNNTLNLCTIIWANATWTASGGNIGPAVGAIIYDYTVSSPKQSPLIGYIDFGGQVTELNGGVATIFSPEVTM